jgi:GNAT superfamily N-acetyltransferase
MISYETSGNTKNRQMNKKVIHRTTIINVPALTKIHREAFRDTISEQEMTWFVKHCLTYWIKDIAYVTIGSTNNHQIILSLAVRPKYQRKGYGTRLMLYALRKNKQRTTVMCSIRKVRFYEKFGFKKIRVYKHYSNWNGQNAVLMIKD